MPAIRAASARLIPSYTAAIASSRRAWSASPASLASRRTPAASKSLRKGNEAIDPLLSNKERESLFGPQGNPPESSTTAVGIRAALGPGCLKTRTPRFRAQRHCDQGRDDGL